MIDEIELDDLDLDDLEDLDDEIQDSSEEADEITLDDDESDIPTITRKDDAKGTDEADSTLQGDIEEEIELELDDEPEGNNDDVQTSEKPVDEIEELDVDDLDLDEEPEVKPEPKTKPKATKNSKSPAVEKPEASKTSKKSKKPIEVVDHKVRFDPDFDISVGNLDIKTMQVRKTKRDPGSIQELKMKIELQGQVEPIQILIRDGKNYLIAGEGRVMALRQLGKNAKAMVYEGLTDEDVLKISMGSNEARLEMAEWDKIVSIGLYADDNPSVNKDNPDDPQSLVSIFGLNKSSVYNYLKMWKFYRDKTEFHPFFEKFRCPLYVLMDTAACLDEYQDKIESYSKVVEILGRIIIRNDLTRKNFINFLMKDITEFLIDAKMSKEIIDVEITNEPLDNPELKRAEKKTKSEIREKIRLTEQEEIEKRIEGNKENAKIKEKAELLLDVVEKHLEEALSAIVEIGEIENFHKLIHSDKIKPTLKKVSKINQMVTVLV